MYYRQPSRRELLKSTAVGFGSLALAGLMDKQSNAALHNPLAASQPHFPAERNESSFCS